MTRRAPAGRDGRWHVRWEGDRCLADRAALATLYGVSEKTVTRHCDPVYRYPLAGRGTVQAEYDAIAAAGEDQLGKVAPRPARTAAALRRTRITTALHHRAPTNGADL